MWKDNSCAADVVVFAALQLNIGISHVEQMGERGLNQLSIPGLTIRAIVAQAWGKMSEEGRMALVARFREDLKYCDSGNFRDLRHSAGMRDGCPPAAMESPIMERIGRYARSSPAASMGSSPQQYKLRFSRRCLGGKWFMGAADALPEMAALSKITNGGW
ncbi:hypothetical protein V501_10063 [Pseudogymnoascus sp. VKM F-4519 (FW-2642)]|nr:hypothetical protein V501_10063 [Pseudogymnoascus sp. VKM F-4519 (FW-2642)]